MFCLVLSRSAWNSLSLRSPTLNGCQLLPKYFKSYIDSDFQQLMYFSCPGFPANPQLDLFSLTTTSDLLFLCTVHVWGVYDGGCDSIWSHKSIMELILVMAETFKAKRRKSMQVLKQPLN